MQKLFYYDYFFELESNKNNLKYLVEIGIVSSGSIYTLEKKLSPVIKNVLITRNFAEKY